MDAVSNALLAGTSATDAAASAAAAGKANQSLTQDQFLKLFVAQLQHQDQLSPLEPDQLTAQLAQFATLEQLTGVNTRLDQLTGVSQNSVLSLIGKQVRFSGGQISVASGTASTVGYHLDAAATAVTATVRASDGSPVRVVELGPQQAGDRTFQFDGKDKAGRTLPDGTYEVDISASAGSGSPPVTPDLVTQGTVDGVDFSVEPPVLLVGTLRIPLNQVHDVHQASSSSGS